MFSKRPAGNPRYRPGDVVKTLKNAWGTPSRYTHPNVQQIPQLIPVGTFGTISEVAPYRPDESYPPRWIYRVRFPGTGETRYWLRGMMIKLVQRNPKIKRTVKRR